MLKRTYAIMGATGHIGQELVGVLLAQGHRVRAVARNQAKLAGLRAKGAETQSAAFDDTAALAKAFEGVSAVFGLIPPAYEADDFGAFQDQVGEAIVSAIKQAKVTSIVNLSSIGAQHRDGTGPIKGLHRQEQRLNRLPGLNVLHLRPGYFMENQLWSIPTIKQLGINGSPMRGDLPVDMVATRDIAAKAAELLDQLSFQSQSVVELAGPRPVTLNAATAILGNAIGKPDLKYVQFPAEDAAQAMLGMGMKPDIVSLMIEMQQGFNQGRVAFEGTPVRGKTSFEEFARVFAKAYQGAPVPA